MGNYHRRTIINFKHIVYRSPLFFEVMIITVAIKLLTRLFLYAWYMGEKLKQFLSSSLRSHHPKCAPLYLMYGQHMARFPEEFVYISMMKNANIIYLLYISIWAFKIPCIWGSHLYAWPLFILCMLLYSKGTLNMISHLILHYI